VAGAVGQGMLAERAIQRVAHDVGDAPPFAARGFLQRPLPPFVEPNRQRGHPE
jgi:hypothetical protein